MPEHAGARPAEERIFGTARQIPPGEARDHFLQVACGDDQTLLKNVLELLEFHDQNRDFLESPPQEFPVDQARVSIPNVSVGDQIGHYKVLELIGEGGMGTVFMAEQFQPVRRTVALKVTRSVIDAKGMMGRLKIERQALALMDHPNIAKFLDAGITPSGHPFFVMELVKGHSLTDYCRQHQVDLKTKLKLFQHVCNGVQHAHQKGIIHRDLKPSNVLVAHYDDRPVAKVIDFGVAKAMGEKLTDNTAFTRFGQLVGTLEYMSPEQAQMNQLDVDTRSDVYGLGAILYELLTGFPPFERKRFRKVAFEEVLRMLREEEPDKPSTRISRSNHSLNEPKQRSARPRRKVSSSFPADLDWIVMKCLEKDRVRRYASASELTQEIDRFLDYQPVAAGPPSIWYRTRKLIDRNLAATAVAIVLVVVIFAGSSISVWQAFRASQAESSLRESNRQLRLERNLSQNEKNAAIDARDLAKLRLNDSRSLVDFMYVRFAEKWLNSNFLYDDQRAVLNRAKKFYKESLFESDDDSDEIQFERALIYLKLGRIQHRLSELQDSNDSLANCCVILDRLIAENRNSIEYQVAYAKACDTQFWNRWKGTDRDGLKKQSERVVERCLTWLLNSPDHTDLKMSLAKAYTNLAYLSEPAQANRLFERATELLSNEMNVEAKKLLAGSYRRWAYYIEQIEGKGNSFDAKMVRAKAIKALRIYESLDTPESRLQLSPNLIMTRGHLAASYFRDSDPQQGKKYLSENKADLEPLPGFSLETPEFAADSTINALNFALYSHAESAKTGKVSQSHIRSLHKALESVDQYAKNFPEDRNHYLNWYRVGYSNSIGSCSVFNAESARVGIEFANQYLSRLESGQIDFAESQLQTIAELNADLAALYSIAKQHPEFLTTQKKVLGLTEKPVKGWANEDRLRLRCQLVTKNCSPEYFDFGLAMQTCKGVLAEEPAAIIHEFLGEAYFRNGDWKKAAQEYQTAIDAKDRERYPLSDEQIFFFACAICKADLEVSSDILEWWQTAPTRWRDRQLNAYFLSYHRRMVEDSIKLIRQELN